LSRRRLLISFALAALLAAGLATPANASQLVDRNAWAIRLAVNVHGEALVTYRTGRRVRHVLAWGAINARPPTRSVRQVKLRLDYAGGWGKYHRLLWRHFGNTCAPYDGPAIPWAVAACKAADGSYWALQAWRRPLPDLGFAPWRASQRARELRLSHWTGPLATIEAYTDWQGRRHWHEIFGRVTYMGVPVHGFHTTRYGAPTDGYGRLVYLDTFDSRYGRGWRRENSFVTHDPSGGFCYRFYRRNPKRGGYMLPRYFSGRRGPGNGRRYRLTVMGPGVTPDIQWYGNGLPRFNRRNPTLVAYEAQMNAMLGQLMAGDGRCGAH
jgi:hypothetical protein